MPRFTATRAPLAAGGTWSSNTLMTEGADRTTGLVFSDQAGTVYIDQSIDGENWDLSESFTVTASTGRGWNVELLAPFYRVRYVNGGVAQTTFRLASRQASSGYRG